MLAVALVAFACGAFAGRLLLCDRYEAAPLMVKGVYQGPVLYCVIPAPSFR